MQILALRKNKKIIYKKKEIKKKYLKKIKLKLIFILKFPTNRDFLIKIDILHKNIIIIKLVTP